MPETDKNIPHRNYLIFIKYKYGCQKGKEHFSLTKSDLNRSYVNRYNNNAGMFLAGETVYNEQIEKIQIFQLENYDEKLRDDIIHEDFETILVKCNQDKEDFTEVTGQFLKTPQKQILTKVRKGTLSPKIFIVHGRDEAPALSLQKHLGELNLDAEMFEDFKKVTTSNTIIQTLEDIKEQISYAFIIATPDDLGCLCDDIEECEKQILLKGKDVSSSDVHNLKCQFNTRARQNVVFEYGLFIGALGRERVCCLLQTNTKEKPSDLSGVLYEEYDRRVNETFPAVDAKLKNIGLIK